MYGRAVAVLLAAAMAVAAACSGSGDGDGGAAAKLPSGDMKKRAAKFAACAKKSAFVVVRPTPPNERTDFLHQDGFTFAEVDLEERPLLFFAAIVDFFPSRADATRARERISASLFGPPSVRTKNVVVHYTDEPGTAKRKQVEEVVGRCLRA